MSNGIQPLRPGGANPYLETQTKVNAQPQTARTSAPERPESAPATRLQQLQGLSEDEAEMIEKLFPENGPTSMRLYGPGGTGREITARGVGGRLDLSA